MTSDRDAFLKIRGRLVADIGRLIELVIADASKNPTRPPPFWALLRALLPIAESIGDLVYQPPPRSDTAENLRCIFADELVHYNQNYRRVAALLSLIYRHSLMHQDELRVVEFEGHTVVWAVGFQGVPHLSVTVSSSKDQIRIEFDTKQFYDDLVRLSRRSFRGAAGTRYEDWQRLPLRRLAPSSTGLKTKAVHEIDQLLAP